MGSEVDGSRRGRSTLRGGVAVLVLLVAAGGGFTLWQRVYAASPDAKPATAERAGGGRNAGMQGPVPVTTARATTRDVDVILSGLGTVQASQTVSIHSRVDGTLQSVSVSEGQEVHAGDVLAKLDPRLPEAALAQAQAAQAKDDAQLRSAQADLARYTSLAQKDYASKQSLDQQQATVDQLKASILSDQAAIKSAQTQLDYMTITAPVDGRIGLRQLDAGNLVHASDSTPITVLATMKPISVVFTLPEKDLETVRTAMRAGTVQVVAIDQGGTTLGTGRLDVLDNQIDTTTGTLKLKATFANDDERLWPGAFVHVAVTAQTLKDALTLPSAAVQRGPDGLYVWRVTPDSHAEITPVETGPTSDGLTVVLKGIAAGDQVVKDGQYKLRPKSRIAEVPGDTSTAAAQ